MTPAINILKQSKTPYSLLEYQHDSSATSYGNEAVEKLSLDARQVFKTLVITCDNEKLAVAIVPVDLKLNLKAIASALKVKKVKMADVKRVEASSGYVLGGVSPLGQKRLLPTVIDISAENFSQIYVSGGKRGLEIALCPKDLAHLCKATYANISN